MIYRLLAFRIGILFLNFLGEVMNWDSNPTLSGWTWGSGEAAYRVAMGWYHWPHVWPTCLPQGSWRSWMAWRDVLKIMPASSVSDLFRGSFIGDLFKGLLVASIWIIKRSRLEEAGGWKLVGCVGCFPIIWGSLQRKRSEKRCRKRTLEKMDKSNDWSYQTCAKKAGCFSQGVVTLFAAFTFGVS